MKACIIQPYYSKDFSRAEELLHWELDALDRCDDSMDLIVLPEYADVPAMAATWEELMDASRRFTEVLLNKCKETARRCDAVVFVNAFHKTPTGPRNTTYAIDRQGQEAGHYYKKHLVPRETDKYLLDSGYTYEPSQPVVITIDGIRYGFLTCYDFYFYESYAAIARQNVDILIGCCHQRSDTLQALELINRFCAYHTNAYVVRASVCLEPGGNVGGGSQIVSPFGAILADMANRVGMACAEFDPHEKYFKPAGFGNPPAAHWEYIDQGRHPWQYRPAGTAIGLPDCWMPWPRICAVGGFAAAGPRNSLSAIGAAVGMGAKEVEIDVSCTDGILMALPDDGNFDIDDEFVGMIPAPLEAVLQKFSCHTILNLRLRPSAEGSLQKLTELVYQYDCTKYVYVTSEKLEVLRQLKAIAPWLLLCLKANSDFEAAQALGCKKVELTFPSAQQIEKAHSLGLRCTATADTAETAEKLLAMGADCIRTRNFCPIAALTQKGAAL